MVCCLLFLLPYSRSNIRQIPRTEASGFMWSLTLGECVGGVEQRVPSHLAISAEIQGAKFPPLLSDKDHGDLHDCTQPSPILAKSKDTEERICKSSGREWGLVVCVSQSHPFLLKSDQWPLTALIGGLYLVLSLVYHQPSASFIHIASLGMCFFFQSAQKSCSTSSYTPDSVLYDTGYCCKESVGWNCQLYP